ncbi:hypothetical protein GCM10010302_25190 [Streptomyces polychromogenes]|uniref:Uncharacterized protein n=1 Tax=Streptomyces polychromogenes TaxID=67342 RepID=A0ABP3F1W3_9ACTN
MARIRTIKPEAFASESLAAVSLTAERTFFGLLTQADDHGRFRDQPAVLAGLLWSLRPDHGPVGVEDDLDQLATQELVCRYAGEDGKRYLHIVSWHLHQKINRPSGVRHPACARHDEAGVVLGSPHGVRQGTPVPPQRGLTEASEHGPEGTVNRKNAGRNGFNEASVTTHGAPREPAARAPGPDLGPRNVDLGSLPSGSASAPVPEHASAQELIAEYAAACTHRPPRDVLGRLGREVSKLLSEGIDAAHVREGLNRHRAKGLHPSTLPSVVHEVMNAAPTGLARTGTRPNLPGHRAWANPADPAAAYAEEL